MPKTGSETRQKTREAASLCDPLRSSSVYLERTQNRFQNTPEDTRSGITLRPPPEPVCIPRACPKPVPKHTRKHAKRHHCVPKTGSETRQNTTFCIIFGTVPSPVYVYKCDFYDFTPTPRRDETRPPSPIPRHYGMWFPYPTPKHFTNGLRGRDSKSGCGVGLTQHHSRRHSKQHHSRRHSKPALQTAGSRRHSKQQHAPATTSRPLPKPN